MGNHRPVKTKDWITYLRAHGCKPAKGTKHTKWKCPNCIQSITFRGNKKEIPADHIKSNLGTMGYDMDYLLNWIAKN